uniref:Uncharacterized protein n=1 Tax=Schistosoma haematobium TaxID=6185 RepID=A0A095BZF5_SCHHA
MSNVISGKILIPVSFGAYASMDYPFIVLWGEHIYRPYKIPFYYAVVPTEYSSSLSSYENYGDNHNNEILESERQAEDLYYYDRITNDKTSPTSRKDDRSYKNDNYQTSFYDNIKYTQPDYNAVKKNKSNSMYSKYNYKMPEVTNSHNRKRLHKESTYKYKPNVHKLKKFGYNDQYKVSKTVYSNDNLRKYHNNNRKNNDKFATMKLKYYDQLIDYMSKPDYDNKNYNEFNYRKYQNPKRVYKKPMINVREMLNDVYEKKKLKNGDKKRREEYSNDRNDKPKPDNEKNYIDRKTNYDEGINRKAPKNKMGKSEKKREGNKEEVNKKVKHPSEDDVSVIKVVNEYA